MAPSNPDIVYIGMGETELRGNVTQGDGVYKTTDGGKTWTHVGLSDTQAIAKIRVHPTNPDIVYVAAFGHPAGPNAERGVFRTKDGGRTWQKVLYRDDKTGGIEVVLDPNNPQVLLRLVVGGVPGVASDVERRRRQRAVQVDRRRRHLDRDLRGSRACRRA